MNKIFYDGKEITIDELRHLQPKFYFFRREGQEQLAAPRITRQDTLELINNANTTIYLMDATLPFAGLNSCSKDKEK